MSKLQEQLKELRTQAGLSQKKMADILNVSQVAIAHWENGSREPSIEMIINIAKYFNVSPSYLMGWDKEFIQPINNLTEMFKHTTCIDISNKTLESFFIPFSKLNKNGQKKATEYINDLTKIPEYRKDTE